MDEVTPQQVVHSRTLSGHKRQSSRASVPETMPPPPVDDVLWSPAPSFGARSTRSLSTTSRNSNRLSLTLPIAPPSNSPSRPTPINTNAPSFPPTPKDTPLVRSPTDANDFIHAIAAQERRVLEIREDLKNAEAELTRLKKQWGAFDSVRKRNAMVNGEPLRSTHSVHNSPATDDVEATRRSIELDRRRTMMMSQQLNKEGTPNSGRRRVIRGGHTRALSLLSPTKPQEFHLLDLDDPLDAHKPPVKDSEPHLQHLGRSSPITVAQLNKRASWAPRSASPNSNNGVKQMAEDFKAGLWTFVDDLRQVAVGDEPINGGGIQRRGSNRMSDSDKDGDTIRASVTPARPRLSSAFSDVTPTPTSRFMDPLKESDTANLGRPRRTNSKRTKHFSWTPLSVDSFDDSDWSNWDSPVSSSPRWSGTTVNGDMITPIPEKGDENDPPLKNETAASSDCEPPVSPSPSALKLEELSLSVLNKLRSLGEPVTPLKNKAC
ncbi:hypothetical protein INS49_014765 [Diaporthe citri]|uniref:uncharacterized protein n=1 Tax=Diaporthe citri TaxID=83186 RepID=UPI001C81FA60|nr:uncharacterized protein INS49_014765 [Diaporthe citri]KAG6356890.1 hypothetical protein INS49_014765 [Diaporthe citri]